MHRVEAPQKGQTMMEPVAGVAEEVARDERDDDLHGDR